MQTLKVENLSEENEEGRITKFISLENNILFNHSHKRPIFKSTDNKVGLFLSRKDLSICPINRNNTITTTPVISGTSTTSAISGPTTTRANVGTTTPTINCSVYSDTYIGLPNQCLTELWKSVGCTTSASVTDNYATDGWWKSQTKKKVHDDMKAWATLNTTHHREACYGPSATTTLATKTLTSTTLASPSTTSNNRKNCKLLD